jgi:hypothetical protein
MSAAASGEWTSFSIMPAEGGFVRFVNTRQNKVLAASASASVLMWMSANEAEEIDSRFEIISTDGAEGHTVDESQAKPAAPGVPAPQPQAVYVADVTVPDGSFFEPGSTFPKVQPLLHRRHPAASPCGISGVLFEPCV